MMTETSFDRQAWPAPAKINLFLHVTGRRDDGYHELQTLFQILDWGDDVHIVRTDTPEIRRPHATYPVAEDDDLVVRAARLLQGRTGTRQGAVIEVVKRIPAGAGLGGGSSDAATVLVVLNRLWHCALNTDELAALGCELGADVPVFVRGRSALATGIGEQLRNIDLGERHYVLVFPDFMVATGEIFSDPDLPRDSSVLSLDQVLAGVGVNDCERVVSGRFPEFGRLMNELAMFGEPAMTGTGSCIFIRMQDKKSAISTARQIKCRYNVAAVRGVDRSPLHQMLDSGPHPDR